MFCKQCGKSLRETETFCAKCGSPCGFLQQNGYQDCAPLHALFPEDFPLSEISLPREETSNVQTLGSTSEPERGSSAAAPPLRKPEQPEPNAPVPWQGSQNSSKKKSWKKPVLAGLAAVCAVGAGLLAWQFVMTPKEDETSSASQTMSSEESGETGQTRPSAQTTAPIETTETTTRSAQSAAGEEAQTLEVVETGAYLKALAANQTISLEDFFSGSNMEILQNLLDSAIIGETGSDSSLESQTAELQGDNINLEGTDFEVLSLSLNSSEESSTLERQILKDRSPDYNWFPADNSSTGSDSSERDDGSMTVNVSYDTNWSVQSNTTGSERPKNYVFQYETVQAVKGYCYAVAANSGSSGASNDSADYLGIAYLGFFENGAEISPSNSTDSSDCYLLWYQKNNGSYTLYKLEGNSFFPVSYISLTQTNATFKISKTESVASTTLSSYESTITTKTSHTGVNLP